MWLVFRYALAGFRAAARDRRELALENIALRHQIEVLTRSRCRPPLRPGDRLLWSWLSRTWPDWRHHVMIVQPDTVVRWHRTAWRRYWTWKSRGAKRGRPRVEAEVGGGSGGSPSVAVTGSVSAACWADANDHRCR